MLSMTNENEGCLPGDALIATNTPQYIYTMRQLFDDVPTHKIDLSTFRVISLSKNTKMLVSGTVSSVAENGARAIFDVSLCCDGLDDYLLRSSRDQKFLMSDGTYQRVDELCPGDQLHVPPGALMSLVTVRKSCESLNREAVYDLRLSDQGNYLLLDLLSKIPIAFTEP